MDWNLKITDMAGATPEHSSVIVNFVAAVRYQLKNSTCSVSYTHLLSNEGVRYMEQLLIVEDDIGLNQGLCKALKVDDRKIISCQDLKKMCIRDRWGRHGPDRPKKQCRH